MMKLSTQSAGPKDRYIRQQYLGTPMSLSTPVFTRHALEL